MPMPCMICLDAAKTQRAAELIATGMSDGKVAAELGGVSRAGVQRHRVNHIIRPAQDRLAVLRKGTGPREAREQLAHAAAADAPSPQEFADAFLGLKAQAQKLEKIEARLERLAVQAEAAKSANSVAQIAAQQLRSVEVGAKLAGAGGYAPAKAPADGAKRGFAVNIILGGERHEVITVAAEPLTVEGETIGDVDI